MSEPLTPSPKAPSSLRRTLGYVLVLGFAALGFLVFAPKVPRDQTLRFDVPPVLRADGVELPRQSLEQLRVQLRTDEGEVAAQLDLSLRHLEGPRTRPSVFKLREGRYHVSAIASGRGLRFPLEALVELSEGEQLVTLSPVRQTPSP